MCVKTHQLDFLASHQIKIPLVLTCSKKQKEKSAHKRQWWSFNNTLKKSVLAFKADPKRTVLKIHEQ
jgi:hypothetical protein